MLEGAQTDFLTGFFLRESLEKFLEDIIMDSNLNKEPFSLAVVDIDRFKRFNDKYGHSFGDEILKYTASTLRLTLYETDSYFFRYGGDEFIIIIPGKDPKESSRLMSRCNYTVRHRAFLLDSKLFTITISCGVAGYPGDAKTAEELIERADKAMYFSKRHGTNLTTMASMIRYIKLRNALVALCAIAVVVFSYQQLSRQNFFKRGVESVAGRASNIEFVAKTQAPPDVVVLKDGYTYEGRIVAEDKDKVAISLKLGDGEGMLAIPKSKVARIKYGAKAPSKK